MILMLFTAVNVARQFQPNLDTLENYMYLKKICVNGGLVEYHCKSKSQAKRWLRSQGLTQQATSVIKDSFAFITPGNSGNFARLLWQEGISRNSCWVLHHLPPGV